MEPKRILISIFCLLVLAGLGAIAYQGFREEAERILEARLDGDGQQYEEAAAEYIALGPDGEKSLLAILRSEREPAVRRLRAAAVLATAGLPDGRTLRARLLEPCRPPIVPEDLAGVAGLFVGLEILDRPGSREPLVPAGMDLDAGPGRRPLIDAIAEALEPDGTILRIDIGDPDPAGRRKIHVAALAAAPR